jgi:hypothetical protein
VGLAVARDLAAWSVRHPQKRDDIYINFDEDRYMGWDEASGLVSRSFEEWRQVDHDIRVFLNLTTLWAGRLYEEKWTEAEAELNAIFDPDIHYGDEHLGFFENKIQGLWPYDYEWILRAAVVKEAVTAFEVYLEKGLDEALGRKGLEVTRSERHQSPPWPELVKCHKILGSNVGTERIKQIRNLRHLLSHQRGELRTERMRAKFANDDISAKPEADTSWSRSYVGGKVQLTSGTAEEILNDLAAVVRETDKQVWAVAWGGAVTPELDKIRADLLSSSDLTTGE